LGGDGSSPFLAKVVGWLRAGYPDGAPERDYIPLVALLGNHLTSDDLTLIADELAFSAARVRSHLAAEGWPLTIPDRN